MLTAEAATSDLRAAVVDELAAAGLFLEPSQYEAARIAIEAAGRIERDSLRAAVGPRTWRHGLAGVSDHPDDDTVRVLGFGRALTEFMVAPLRLDQRAAESVASLGALANMIVTVFDTLVDAGHPPERLLPRRAVVLAARRDWRTVGGRLAVRSPPRVLARLVDEYFARLHALPYAQFHDRILRCVMQAIARMYDAERETLERTSALSLRRKGTLPFVVMAMPGWLERREAKPAVTFRHLHWAARCGAFFSVIDDIADLADDEQARRPNLISERVARSADPDATRLQLPRRIASEGVAVMADWRDMLDGGTCMSSLAPAAFGTCLVSWLGGSPVLDAALRRPASTF